MATAVQIEVTPDRVFSAVPAPVRSFVHDHPAVSSSNSFIDNRPAEVASMHPLATLLGKLDAIRNQHQHHAEASRYIRHFEDAHHIISNAPTLPPLSGFDGVRGLAEAMLADGQIRGPLKPDAFRLREWTDVSDLELAHAGLSRWHWGSRVSLEDACESICDWLDRERLFG